MMTKQDYSFALDHNQCVINIKDALKGEDFYCPCCGAVMIAKQGKKNRWHFAHKGNLGNCSYETYLHKIAKARIRECFYNSLNFMIEFDQSVICSVKECPLGNSKPCEWYANNSYDLKSYYNSCEEEVTIGQYRADLLLTNTNNDSIPPILIEINVSHQSTEKKLNSDLRIIEIDVDSEDDIDKIVSTAAINNNHLNKIRFYNFHSFKYYDTCKEVELYNKAKSRIHDLLIDSSQIVVSLQQEVPQRVMEYSGERYLSRNIVVEKDINLKEDYNNFREDVIIGNYRFDFYIYNSDNSMFPPILIKIKIKDRFQEESLPDDYVVIEIVINSDKDIESVTQYLKNNKIETSGYYLNPSVFPYNYPYYFWIDSDYIYHFGKRDSSDNEKPPLFCIKSMCKIGWHSAFNELSQSGLGIKYCALCKYYPRYNDTVSSFCRYPMNNNSIKEKILYAMECPYFKQKRFRYYEIDGEPEFRIKIDKLTN